jgi:hypothetical protein
MEAGVLDVPAIQASAASTNIACRLSVVVHCCFHAAVATVRLGAGCQESEMMKRKKMVMMR